MENNVQTNEYDAQAELARRKRKRGNIVRYCIGGALILAGAFIVLRDQTGIFNRNTGVKPSATPDAVIVSRAPEPTAALTYPAEPTKPPPEPTPEPADPPVSVYFAGHDISCAVVPVGVNEKGEMDTVPKHDVAGWYMYGPAPNEPGNCIIAGHNRYHGQKGLFSVLHKGLKTGDSICVTTEGGRDVYYTVESIDEYKYDAVPMEVMEPGGETRLTLITCLGDYDYDMQMSRTRVVAVCKPIENN